jgi:tRNA A37 threonylcarbamoyladenosine dehydratase
MIDQMSERSDGLALDLLQPDMARRFGGLDRLFGLVAAERIRASHVVVVGIGGVGSWAAESLARSGVGQITLIDLDHVAESNINRQVHAIESTVGVAKVQAMRERIGQINPYCQLTCIEEFVSPENWRKLVPLDVDAVIDACDQAKAKLAMAVWALKGETLFVSVGAAGGKRMAHLVEIDDLSKVTHDPVLAQLRYRLRKQYAAPSGGKKMGISCVYSKEAVQGPDASCEVNGDGSLNCHGYGSLVSVTASFGHCAAGWVISMLGSKNSQKHVII